MNKNSITTVVPMVILITILGITGCIETSLAQGRGRGAHRGGVARVYHPVVVRRAHIRYTNLPRWGSVVTTQPSSWVVVRSGRNPYYFSDGIYYAPRNSGFVIVRPARGLIIRGLPIGYRTIVSGPRNYYYYYGSYYTQVDNTNEYRVVDPPVGAVVDALPDGYEIKTRSGIEYYVLDGVHYAEVDAPEFEDGVGYQVVKF